MVIIATTIVTEADIAIIKNEIKTPNWSVDKIINELNHKPTKQAVEHQIDKLIAEGHETYKEPIMQTKDDIIDKVYDFIDIEEKPTKKETLNMSGGRPWTKEEEDIVKANYENLGAAKMVKVKLLKNRTAAAITSKAASFGLKAPVTKAIALANESTPAEPVTTKRSNPVDTNTDSIDFNSVTGLIAVLNGIKESGIIQSCDISVKFDDSLYFKYKKEEDGYYD